MMRQTRLAQAGINSDPDNAAIVSPISLSTTYRRTDPDCAGLFDYARTQHPSRHILERALADLEGAAGACVTASGMAAIDLVLNDLPNSARIICAHDAYGGTRRLFDARAEAGRISVDYVDLTDPDTLSAALSRPCDLVFIETPSNPRLRLTDLEVVCQRARNAGAISVVDNTVLTGALQRPLEWDADIVVASVTKMLNGHSDMVGGMVACADATRADRLAWWLNTTGVGGGAFDAYLATRGLRTLAIRAVAQSTAALELAQRLSGLSAIKHVDYPGLPSHPGHAVARRQQSAFGPLISFEIEGDASRAIEVVQALNVFTLAQSLGGTESLCCIPATMTHAAMSREARQQAGISHALIRLSIGLENVEDLWADLNAAINY